MLQNKTLCRPENANSLETISLNKYIDCMNDGRRVWPFARITSLPSIRMCENMTSSFRTLLQRLLRWRRCRWRSTKIVVDYASTLLHLTAWSWPREASTSTWSCGTSTRLPIHPWRWKMEKRNPRQLLFSRRKTSKTIGSICRSAPPFKDPAAHL